jgi:ferredoxin
MSRPLWFVNLLKHYFPYRKKIAALSQNFIGKKLMDLFLFNGDSMFYLPKDRIVIEEAITPQENMVLPSEIVHHFVEQANHLWIMNHCICRQGDDCQDYPQDLGCLFMGEAVLQINPKLGKLVDKEQAHQHIQRAQDEGLVHLIGRNKLDSIWMGVGPGTKLLTVCNCCPCCCLFKILPDLHPEISDSVRRMPGVEVWVDPDLCIGCGLCAREEVCFVEAITMVNNQSVIGDGCRGCGRCVEICKKDAIKIKITDASFMQTSIDKINRKVDVS